MTISRDRVELLAELARLELADNELDAMAEELGAVLDYASSLDELNLEGVPETTASSMGQHLRADHVLDDDAQVLQREEALGLAPDRDDTHYLVPRVVSND